MHNQLYVLIAACGQPQLLRRTLTSFAACEKPAEYAGVIVVENGRRAGIKQVVEAFGREHRFEYQFSEPPNKSLALNRALRLVGDALCVFTDDDVQVPCGTLVAYAQAASRCTSGEFYGGPIVPDYESASPPHWLRQFLPRSAAGWQLDAADKHAIEQAEFIGPNFAAFASDIRRVGGFDIRLGPGKHMVSPGEDTEIQERLLSQGVAGYYLPDAPVWHFVRTESATVEFALARAERNGVYWGIRAASQYGFGTREWAKMVGQWLNDHWRIARWRRMSDKVAQTRAAFVEARWRGRWQGVRIGRNWNRQAGQRNAA